MSTYIIEETTGDVMELDPSMVELLDTLATADDDLRRTHDLLAALVAEAEAKVPGVAPARERLATLSAFRADLLSQVAKLVPDDRRAVNGEGVRWRTRVGQVSVMWPAPKKVWKKDMKDESIAKRHPDIAATIGLRQELAAPQGPVVKVGGE